MLAYQNPDNDDITILLDNDELYEIEQGLVKGIVYNFNHPGRLGELEVQVAQKKIHDIVEVDIERGYPDSITSMAARIKSSEYPVLRERGTLVGNQDGRQVLVIDVNRLPEEFRAFYFTVIKRAELSVTPTP
jgi:hypothetical protein